MNRLGLRAQERTVLGKKVKTLRKEGKIPAHVFGKGLATEHVSVDTKAFKKIAKEAGETSVIDLKIIKLSGEESVRPVMIKGTQIHAVTDEILNIDFYQVNLKQKVIVPVPIELVGEETEKVKLGEAIVLQTLNSVEVEALPTDLIEKLEVNVSVLKEIDDAITVGELSYDHNKLTVLTDPESIVVKLATAVSEEMQELLEEQAAEQAEAASEETGEESEKKEDEVGEETEGEAKEGEIEEGKDEKTEPKEETS